jgi:hypothetical protein
VSKTAVGAVNGTWIVVFALRPSRSGASAARAFFASAALARPSQGSSKWIQRAPASSSADASCARALPNAVSASSSFL